MQVDDLPPHSKHQLTMHTELKTGKLATMRERSKGDFFILRPLSCSMGCRWRTYHIVHAIVTCMKKKTSKLIPVTEREGRFTEISFSFQMPLTKGCRWMTYPLIVHTTVMHMNKKTITLLSYVLELAT